MLNIILNLSIKKKPRRKNNLNKRTRGYTPKHSSHQQMPLLGLNLNVLGRSVELTTLQREESNFIDAIM